jgi:signal transduction histidine kinase/ActR/RegA family two-component response regulator
MHDMTHYKHRDGTPFPAEECAGLQVLRQGKDLVDHEDVFLRKDGTFFDVLYSSSPLRSGDRITGLVVVFRDITERKRTARRLATQYAITQLLAEFTTLDAIAPHFLEVVCHTAGWDVGAFWCVDIHLDLLRPVTLWHKPSVAVPEFKEISSSRTFARGVGLPGRVWAAAAPLWIPDVARDDNFPRAAVASKEGLHGAFGFPIVVGTREVLGVMEFFSHDVRAPDKELLQMFAIIGNQMGQFMARKRLEEQLRHAQKLESVGVLAGGVAHDFNNLLTGMLGSASLALDQLDASHAVRPLLRDVVRAAEQAAHLTRQLLAYAGKGQFVSQPINLSDLTGEISSLAHISIPKSVHVHLDLAQDVPSIRGDPGQLQQLIMNLVLNAAEAIGEYTNGTVRIATAVQGVDEEYIRTTMFPGDLQPGQYVMLEVQDTGAGMDQATLARMFDPFFTTKFTGRGLGLAAVLGIVRGHKGAIKVFSTQGKGTTFQVLFPAIHEPAARSAAAREEETLPGTGTILVVDDEEVVRRVARHTLERHGYSVLLAANGQEALELFRSQSSAISAVLLDVTMPIMGGEETFKHLQQLRRDVCVILSSGYNEVDAVQRFKGKGFSGFLQKPYTGSQLTQKLQAVLAPRAGTGA